MKNRFLLPIILAFILIVSVLSISYYDNKPALKKVVYIKSIIGCIPTTMTKEEYLGAKRMYSDIGINPPEKILGVVCE